MLIQGQTVTYSSQYSLNNASGLISYLWSISLSNAGTINGSYTNSTVSITWNLSGQHSLSLNAINCGGTVNSIINVNVTELPVLILVPILVLQLILVLVLTCNQDNWTEIAAYCIGLDLYKTEQNDCGDQRVVLIELNSGLCTTPTLQPILVLQLIPVLQLILVLVLQLTLTLVLTPVLVLVLQLILVLTLINNCALITDFTLYSLGSEGSNVSETGNSLALITIGGLSLNGDGLHLTTITIEYLDGTSITDSSTTLNYGLSGSTFACGTVNYSVTVSNCNGSNSVTKTGTMQINFAGAYALIISSNVSSYCLGDTVTFYVSGCSSHLEAITYLYGSNGVNYGVLANASSSGSLDLLLSGLVLSYFQARTEVTTGYCYDISGYSNAVFISLKSNC